MVLFLCENSVGGVTILLCTLSGVESQKTSKLLSRHYFQTEIFKGASFPENCGLRYSS